jgi:hypothetical protein
MLRRNNLLGVLETARKRLAKVGERALNYSMNHERNIGRDSIDESMEEEIFSTEMRLHDREKYLLGKVDKQLARLKDDSIDVCEGLRREDRLQASHGPARDHLVHRLQRAERARRSRGRAGRTGRGIDGGGLGDLGVADE